MKKSMIKGIVLVSGIAFICVILLAYLGIFDRVNIKCVEKIVLYTTDSNSDNTIVLNDDETEEFVKLFNTSKYGGLCDGSGVTPAWKVAVHFRNGEILYVSQFGGESHDVQVRSGNKIMKWKADHFVDSDELHNFLLELVEKYN